MCGKQQFQNLLAISLATVLALGLTVVFTQSASGQTFKLIYTFTGGNNGANPETGLTLDNAGNLYGTTAAGDGNCYPGCGTVFGLIKQGSEWNYSSLYSFHGRDGYEPSSRVVIRAGGVLYGSTGGGGIAGHGNIYTLKPPGTLPSGTKPRYWTETVLYEFTGGGEVPSGDLVFDNSGNIYGTTQGYGVYAPSGSVYELTQSGGGWAENTLYPFTGGTDGGFPVGGIVFDKAGNHLYGTTVLGGDQSCNVDGGYGYGCGTVFRLTHSQSGWTEDVLKAFQIPTALSTGIYPYAGLIMDESGNLYGTAALGGSGGGGVVFQLTPSNGGWTYTVLHNFTSAEGWFPNSPVLLDATGNLYGTLFSGGPGGAGAVFKLTPGASGWTYKSLHDFTEGSDGGYPEDGPIFDANGNLYGTAYLGGSFENCYSGCGVVWEITP